jgi:hypothetical protein
MFATHSSLLEHNNLSIKEIEYLSIPRQHHDLLDQTLLPTYTWPKLSLSNFLSVLYTGELQTCTCINKRAHIK